MRPVPWVILAVAASLCLSGCGGGGGDDSVTVTIASSGAIDGFVNSMGAVGSAGGGPVVGDLDCGVNGVSCMMFFHFDISGIPASATILSATFQPYLAGHRGDPLVVLGNQTVDHVDFGAVLDAFDYPLAASLATDIGTAADNLAVGYRSVDATSSVIVDRAAARLYSEFRIRNSLAPSNMDGMCDYLTWEDGENSYLSGHLPVLRVTYRP